VNEHTRRREKAQMRYLTWALLLAILTAAAVPVAAAEGKVAVMDLDMIITESEAGKVAAAQLEALIQEKQALVDTRAEAILELQGELEAASAQGREDASKQEELQRLVAEYQQLVEDSEAEIQARAAEMRNQLLSEIGEVVRRIGIRDNYALILDVSLVHFYTQAIDITWDVIREYNSLKQ